MDGVYEDEVVGVQGGDIVVVAASVQELGAGGGWLKFTRAMKLKLDGVV